MKKFVRLMGRLIVYMNEISEIVIVCWTFSKCKVTDQVNT